MKFKTLLIVLFAIILGSCDTSGVEKPAKKVVKKENTSTSNMTNAEKLIEPLKTIVEKKSFPNGLKIQWFKHGTGELLKAGEAIELNFKVKLNTGEVVDGNHKLNKDWIPYLIGFGMQPKGWDLAMNELKVGDFVEIYLPANLARGEKGVPGIIPPNSPNTIFLRVGKKIQPNRIVDGTKVWFFEQSPDATLPLAKENSAVALHYFVGTPSNPKYDNSYQRNQPFSFNMSDKGLVPGFRKALINAKLFDKMWILVPPDQAYGKKGFLDRVKPNESVFYDCFVSEIDGQK